VEEDEENEDDEVEMPRMVLNRQVAKRHWFTLYVKMAAV